MTAYQRVGWARTLMLRKIGDPPRILWVFLWRCGECLGQTFSPAEHRCMPPLTTHLPSLAAITSIHEYQLLRDSADALHPTTEGTN